MTFPATQESIAGAALLTIGPVITASACCACPPMPMCQRQPTGCIKGMAPPEPTAAQQLDALFKDAAFPKLLDATTTEVMRVWNIPRRTAAGFVMSAVGEPSTLACIHHEWFSAKINGTGFGLAKLIVRRRVFDLLRVDARRPHHASLPPTPDQGDQTLRSLPDRSDHGPHAQAELNQIANLVRTALQCFAERGPVQARQAELVRRYALDEITSSDLAEKLACSPNALRVRIHKAMRALRKHIETCHPELEDLLEHASARSKRS
jgi:hypothetical protein